MSVGVFTDLRAADQLFLRGGHLSPKIKKECFESVLFSYQQDIKSPP